MTHTKKQKISGFTLIELSIVLVIISLIVGGIIGGKALIKSAELQSVVTDVNKYQTAVNTFLLQYDALPGDMIDAYDYFANGSSSTCGSNGNGQGGCNGNGNGTIGDDSGDFRGMSEPMRLWKHLSLAGLINNEITFSGVYRDVDTSDSPTIPLSDYRSLSGFLAFNPIQDDGTWAPPSLYGQSGAWFMLVIPPGGNYGNIPIEDTALPKDTAAMDKKMDDGKPSTGKVIAMRSWIASTGCTTPDIAGWDMDTTAPSSTIGYDLDNSNHVCNPMFYLGGN